MPNLLVDVPVQPDRLEPPRKRWTRAECLALQQSGLLHQHHLELVEGELIDKLGKKRTHINALTLIQAWFVEVFGNRFVNAEAPIDVADHDNPVNEPEPDLIVLNRDLANFRSGNPGPQDLHLVLEVADTSLAFDLTTKANVYARAGIIEYWVLDVQSRRLIVHRDPAFGKYSTVMAYGEHESLAPVSAPDATFNIADAFRF
ncbi:MAG: Uma2 family endonuclease [Acidobacteriaceae bacterium]|nr:Uma2 family endonuclease [Acidobacteriaceae bacterium]